MAKAEKSAQAEAVTELLGGSQVQETSDGQEDDLDPQPLTSPRVNIIVHQQDGPGGSDDVTVGVNGYQYQIKRGKKVSVPEEVVNVLRDAVITVYDSNKDGSFTERDVRRFNFSVEP